MRGDSVTATPPPADMTRAGRGSAVTLAGTRGLHYYIYNSFSIYFHYRCCFYTGGGGGGGWNNGGGYNNNKPGSCPPYNGRRKRSPEEAPWNNGGSGYNPGHGHGGHGGGRCIRDSECPGAMKCCYRRSGYQCTRPHYYG